jgi:hypothetical protein
MRYTECVRILPTNLFSHVILYSEICGLSLLGYIFQRVGSGYGQVVGVCEYGEEPLGSIKCGEFLD